MAKKRERGLSKIGQKKKDEGKMLDRALDARSDRAKRRKKK